MAVSPVTAVIHIVTGASLVGTEVNHLGISQQGKQGGMLHVSGESRMFATSTTAFDAIISTGSPRTALLLQAAGHQLEALQFMLFGVCISPQLLQACP